MVKNDNFHFHTAKCKTEISNAFLKTLFLRMSWMKKKLNLYIGEFSPRFFVYMFEHKYNCTVHKYTH